MTSKSLATVITSSAGLLGPDSVIDFETGSTALPSVPGVTLAPYGFGADSTFSTVLFGRQVYGNISGPGGYSDLFASFSPLVTEVGAWGRRFSSSSGPTQLTVNVYGPTNNLLETAILSNTTPTPSFVGFIEPQGISKVEWLGGNQGFFAIDNITYGGPPVPEPTAGAVCAVCAATALSGATARRRRGVGRSACRTSLRP